MCSYLSPSHLRTKPVTHCTLHLEASKAPVTCYTLHLGASKASVTHCTLHLGASKAPVLHCTLHLGASKAPVRQRELSGARVHNTGKARVENTC
ncbi:hypothetical protein E2C01_069910 [Portunus trituberculatus]|uniref:Uncharacterized protein n=1 Tax=Portunus trituberculatus TaxID=210409 RepID=A0A5B7HST9_PORTR|nr:hypothetical protein [Portunus trituberculatus]